MTEREGDDAFASIRVEYLVRIRAPEIVPPKPALVALDLHAAPVVGAAFGDLGDHAGLQDGDCLGAAGRVGAQGARLVDDEGAALARKQVLLDPADGAVAVADPPPGVELPDDLHRQALALIDPEDGIVRARTGAQIDLAAVERGETRQREMLLILGHGRREPKPGNRQAGNPPDRPLACDRSRHGPRRRPPAHDSPPFFKTLNCLIIQPSALGQGAATLLASVAARC